jgi:hypothetical protein
MGYGQLPLADTSGSAEKSPLAVMPEMASLPADSVSVLAVAFLTIPTAAFRDQRRKIGRREEQSYRVQPRQTLMPDPLLDLSKVARREITVTLNHPFTVVQALILVPTYFTD